jgi:alpha-methylacyl-CoA racemase
MSGPLNGVRVLELTAQGPVPFAGMMMADLGADVIRIDRVSNNGVLPPLLGRGRRSVALDLKQPSGREAFLRMATSSEIIIEGFRPGVMERLGIGPDVCMARNRQLVYGRATGWGQNGPLATAAGHDVNYIALSGALHASGGGGPRPTPPLNFLGDYGGGGMLLVVGVLAAALEARGSGTGQVVDAAIIDGTSLFTTVLHELASRGLWTALRGANELDGGQAYYDVYETACGGFIALGAIEPEFFAALMALLGLDVDRDRISPSELRQVLAATFKSRSRFEWCELLEGTDACFAPVLAIGEAPDHPHNRARGSHVLVDGMLQPAPAPRFSRTVPKIRRGAVAAGLDTVEVLAECGLSSDEIALLLACRAAMAVDGGDE